MNPSNRVPANNDPTSPLGGVPAIIQAWFISVLLPMLRFFAWDWVPGAAHEFGLIRSDPCGRHNAEIRANSRQLWTRTVAAFHDMRFHRNITGSTHPGRERAPACAIMPHAAGRQSGQRRTPRRGGQAKKASNDPDGGDGEPPRPPHSLHSSRHHALYPHTDSTHRPLIFAGGAL